MTDKKKGQASKLTEAMVTAICDHLRNGHYRSTAAHLVGIHAVTFSKWMGLEGEPYESFQQSVLAAEAEAEQRQLTKITESPEPADAKWYLARKFPDRWAETRRIDVSGRLDMGIKLNADVLRDPQARAAVSVLTDALFANGYSEPDRDGTGSDE